MVSFRRASYTLMTYIFMLFAFVGVAAAGPLDQFIKGGKVPGASKAPPVEQALLLNVTTAQDDQLLASWTMLPGVYLYRDRIKFSSPNPNVVFGKPVLPPGKDKEETGLEGKPVMLVVYYDKAQITVPIVSAPKGAVTVNVTYQGCDGVNGVCYLPVDASFDLVLKQAVDSPISTQPDQVEPTAEQGFLEVLRNESIVWALLLAFVFGAGLALTPCSYPVIPLVSAAIVGGAQHVSRRRLVALSLAYVLGIVVVYAAVGALFAWVGSNLFGSAQSPWVLGPIGVLIVIFALSMYGLFNLQLPTSLQSKLNTISARQQGGSIVSVYVLGLFSALIMGACTTPFIAATLTFIGQSGDVVFGMAVMAMLGAGQGAPLILIAALAGMVMPKAGSWMDVIKTLLATMLLAGALLLVGNLFAPTIKMLLWGVWFVVLGVQLGAFYQIEKPGPIILAKGMGIAAVMWGAIIMVGAAAGGSRLDKPLSGLAIGGYQAEPAAHMTYVNLPDIDVLQSEFNKAKTAGKPVFLSITAPEWCASCVVNEREVLSKPDVVAAFDAFSRLEINLDESSPDEAQMLKVLNLQIAGKHAAIVGPPVMLFYDRAGKLQLSLSGKVTSAKLLAVAKQLSK